MSRPKLIVTAAVVLIFAQVHCAVTCADQVCSTNSGSSESAPPCHRHHDPSGRGGTQSCARYAIVQAKSSSQTPGSELTSFLAPIPAVPVWTELPGHGQGESADSRVRPPLKPDGPLSVVLRI